jgi:hypothetical protein
MTESKSKKSYGIRPFYIVMHASGKYDVLSGAKLVPIDFDSLSEGDHRRMKNGQPPEDITFWYLEELLIDTEAGDLIKEGIEHQKEEMEARLWKMHPDDPETVKRMMQWLFRKPPWEQ